MPISNPVELRSTGRPRGAVPAWHLLDGGTGDGPLAMWTAYNRVRRVTKFHSVIGYPFKGLPV